VLADATLGLARPDVEATYELGSTFGATGFAATVTLPATGAQQVTVCARSAITATFAVRQTLSLTTPRRHQRLRRDPLAESSALVRPATTIAPPLRG
jgi:hypothetical protein